LMFSKEITINFFGFTILFNKYNLLKKYKEEDIWPGKELKELRVQVLLTKNCHSSSQYL
jgi:hypothetical protein